MRGLINIDRALLSHHIVGMQHKDRFCAWIWMLCAARWRPGRIMVDGEEIELHRGQFFASIRTIVKETGVSKAIIERLVRDLKTGTMIKTVNKTRGMIVTICNYDTYQDINQYRETADKTPNKTVTRHEQDSNKTVTRHKRNPDENPDEIPEYKTAPKTAPEKGSENKQTGTNYTDDFEAFWKAYPKRSGTNPKLPAFKKWKGFIKSGVDKDLIIQGAAAYAKSREGQDAQFTQQASTWLNQAGWEQFSQDEAHTNGKSETVTINGQLRWKHEVVDKVREFHETGDWSKQTFDVLGPPPGELGCVIPADILRQSEKLH